MYIIKNSFLEIIVMLLCVCSVFIYKVPNTIEFWLLNSIITIILSVCIIRIALKLMHQ